MLFRRRRTGAPPKRRRRIRKLRLTALLAVLGLLATSSFTFGVVSAIASEVDRSCDPAQRIGDVNGYIYASDGKTVLAVLRGSESRVLVDTHEIDPDIRQAIVAVEDRRFWEHRGIDLRGIGRALVADIRQQRVVEGGSTITQQFVKNSCVKNERTIARKVREAALAWQLERPGGWTKDEILTAYLNTIYFGNGAYGIQQAAKIYFDKGASNLTLPEAALLAGIPADPTGYDPVTNPREARERREKVLRDMLELGRITEAQFDRANAAPLPPPEEVRLPGTQGPAPYFTNYVKEQLVADKDYGARAVFGGGLKVTTTIDLELQRLARAAIAKWLPDPEGPHAALVAVDPTTGNVVAMVGGHNYRESQFNLAVQGERQPGSAFKPIVLATALEQGIAPQTTFESRPLDLWIGDRYWPVSNYDESYLGRIDLGTATMYSDNAVYAQLTRLVGPAAVARTARRLGIRRKLDPFFSIGLGAQAVTPLELARAYSAFANGGYRIDTGEFGNRPRVVDTIEDKDGDLEANLGSARRVLTERTAAIVNEHLQNVVQGGTGTRAMLPAWPAAGKTGTTDNYGDAWFVGYTPKLVVAVWVGYPKELRPMLTEYHGEPVAGGTFPALIWKSFMERALPRFQKEPLTFEPPPAEYVAPRLVVQRDGVVQLDNGLCANRVEVVYFGGVGPRRTANCKPNEVDVPNVRGLKLDVAKARLAAQPLTPVVIYKWAKPFQRTDVVLDQQPRKGRLSTFESVLLVLAKPRHGVLPEVEGLRLRTARERLRKLKVRTRVVRFSDAPPGRVAWQAPRPGVAVQPGMTVKLVVGRGSGTASPPPRSARAARPPA